MQTNQLLKVIAITGVSCSVGIAYLQYRTQRDYASTPYYRKSMQIFRDNAAAMKLIGEPVRERKVDLYETYVSGNKAKLKVPLRGSSQNGDLYLWAERPDSVSDWDVIRLELALKKVSGQRLLVYANPDYAADYTKTFDAEGTASSQAS